MQVQQFGQDQGESRNLNSPGAGAHFLSSCALPHQLLCCSEADSLYWLVHSRSQLPLAKSFDFSWGAGAKRIPQEPTRAEQRCTVAATGRPDHGGQQHFPWAQSLSCEPHRTPITSQALDPHLRTTPDLLSSNIVLMATGDWSTGKGTTRDRSHLHDGDSVGFKCPQIHFIKG